MPDVIIVGAGPSGSTLAYALAKKGVEVAIIDAKKFPRYKTCGGACDGLFFGNLPQGMTVKTSIEDKVNEVIVRYQGRNESRYPIPAPMVMTQRPMLDLELLKQAEIAGATFYDGHPVKEVKRLPGGNYEVQAGPHTFYAPIVVGADGAYSTVAKFTDLPRPRTLFVAAEWDVAAPPEVIQEWRGKALIDCSVFPFGYAWVFPKSDHLNIGFGLPRKLAEQVHDLTARFAQLLGWDVEAWGYKKRAHQIPFALPGSRVVQDGIVLVGDAAGMADPTTGAGISWGVRSSKQAASWIAEALRTGDLRLLDHYQADYEQTLLELRAGMALRNILALNFALRHRESPSAWKWMLAVLSNQATYTEWAREHPLMFKIGITVQRFVVPRLV